MAGLNPDGSSGTTGGLSLDPVLLIPMSRLGTSGGDVLGRGGDVLGSGGGVLGRGGGVKIGAYGVRFI